MVCNCLISFSTFQDLIFISIPGDAILFSPFITEHRRWWCQLLFNIATMTVMMMAIRFVHERQNMRVVCFGIQKKKRDKVEIKRTKWYENILWEKERGISCLPRRRQDVAVAPPALVMYLCCMLLSLSLFPSAHNFLLKHDFCFQPSYLIYLSLYTRCLSLFFLPIHSALSFNFLGVGMCVLFPLLFGGSALRWVTCSSRWWPSCKSVSVVEDDERDSNRE